MDSRQSAADQKLEAMSGSRTRLLKMLREKKTSDLSETLPSLPEDEFGTDLPLSWAQQRLWFIEQLEDFVAAYHITLVIDLKGTVDVSALHAALDAIVERHESLRTVFVETQGEPRRRVLPEARFSLTQYDLTNLEEEFRQDELTSHEREENHTKFDLGKGPLIRGRLLRLEARRAVLMTTMHHIISDGWSTRIFVEELERLHSLGERRHLKKLPIQYSDFVRKQRDFGSYRRFDHQLAYWRERLAGAQSTLDLPTDKRRPTRRTYEGGDIQLRLDSGLTSKLKALGRQEGMTLFMVLYAAWTVLLTRMSGQEDISVGVPVTNRDRPELEGIIGLFVNTIVLRQVVRGRATITEFLRQVKDVVLGGLDHQEVPFEKVVEVLQPHRALNRNPLFQVMFVMQDVMPALSLSGATGRVRNAADTSSTFDLVLYAVDDHETVACTLNYSKELFRKDTAQRIAARFEALLTSVVESRPEHTVSELSIMPAAERLQIAKYSEAQCPPIKYLDAIHERFQRQVELTPDAVALVDGDGAMTYLELNRRANQLGRYLRRCGVTSGQLVGLYLQRGLELIVGILGILKAGAGYVPLDPGHPDRRRSYVLGDARPQILVTQKSLEFSSRPSRLRPVFLDSDAETIFCGAADNLPRGENEFPSTAYVIYTSGSTGEPKGVVVEHRNVARLFVATESLFRFGSDDVWTLFHSTAFDFSVWEMWGPLFYGGRLVIVPQSFAQSPKALLRLIRDQSVTVLSQTPSAFRQLIASHLSESDQCVSLRSVIFGGEALELGSLRPWVARYGAQRPLLVNMYGITETTVHVTYRALSASEIEQESASVIGRPLPDLRVYLLDPYGQPVPFGVRGELFVAGGGVTQGYLRRSALTAYRFIADPFDSAPSSRMYRTGDLGRWCADGELEYLGRNDRQVKIRGFRIELGEISARLEEHPAVRQAVVVAREEVPGDKRLVGYVTLRDRSSTFSADALRTYLKDTLPDYMIPSAFIVLVDLPLTGNGKLDTASLPEPKLVSYARAVYEIPRGELECALAGIWQKLLRIEKVGRNDNFFELGGHSMLVVQLVDRLRRVGLSVDVRQVFETVSLAELAAHVTRNLAPANTVPPNLIPPDCLSITPEMLTLVSLAPEHVSAVEESIEGGAANIHDIYPLSPLQEGILFHYLLDEGRYDTYTVTTLLSVPSADRLQALISALQKVVDRHDVLRTAILWERVPLPLQVVQRRAVLQVAEVMLRVDCKSTESVMAELEGGSKKFDLRRAPLLRLYFAKNPVGTTWYVLLQMHHIVCDHVTLDVIISEVVQFVEQHRLPEGNPAPYRDYVARTLARADKRMQEEFFRKKLADVEEPTMPFGLRSTRGDVNSILENVEPVDPSLARRIRAAARKLGVSSATVFHAAWGLVAAHTSGRNDVVFGTVLLGRIGTNSGSEPPLGVSINTLPIRLRLNGTPCAELLEVTQKELVDLLAYEQAPLSMAQRCSGVSPALPLFTSLINYRHNSEESSHDWSDAEGIQVVGVRERTNYPITISIDDLGEGFNIAAQADRQIGPGRVVRYLQVALQSLVTALEEGARTPALALSVMPTEERTRVIKEFNATERRYPQDQLLHQLFEEQATRTPRAIALVYEGTELTYADLNARANQLAWHLIDRGVGPERIVGISLERSIEMVVGLLGILKAGGAYLPLDPGYPTKQLQYMLGDAKVNMLLSQERLESRLSEICPDLIALDDPASEIWERSVDNPDPRSLGLGPSNLAYVIYTSGSTGMPKGAMNEHRGITNRLRWMQDQYEIGCQDRVLQKTPFSFDVSVWEFFWTLMTGAKMVIARPEAHKDPFYIRELIQRAEITTIHFVPSMLHSFLEQYLTGSRSSLRRIICSGEELPAALQARCLECIPHAELWNLYGPTEAAVDVTSWKCRADPHESKVPIGKPIANLSIYVLGHCDQPVPVGIPGEIHIGGVGVGRGYLSRPALTVERFVKDPYGESPARMYKTGDVGRWRADGSIEYLGRRDHQVKIRGLRIELGEIEAQLARHEAVSDVVVLAREDQPGEKRLVAYIVAKAGLDVATLLDATLLRAYLRSRVPEHMVPSAFVFLKSLPLSPNGKLDRRALPAPEPLSQGGRQYEPPRGQMEELLCKIWSDLLHVQNVSRDDDFFELGGHSLYVVRLIGKLMEHFNVRLAVPAVFRAPTIQQLAALIESLLQSAQVAQSAEATEFQEGTL